jgi:hypothetical protein
MFQIFKSKKMVETKPAANKILKVNKSKHQSCCVNCGLRTDRPNIISNRRVITGWMIDFFKAKKIDVSHHYQICYTCRVSLYKARKDNSVVEKENEISGLLSKAKFDDNSYFDQLPESDFPVLTGALSHNSV